MMHAKQIFTLLIVSLMYFTSYNQCNAQATVNQTAGKMNIISGSYLVINGNLINSSIGNDAIALAGEIDLTGNFTNNAASGNLLSGSSGTVVLNGTTQQTIGGSASIYFPVLKTDNAAGIIIDQLSYIETSLVLTTGIINTSTGKELVMLDGSSYTGGSNTSFVDGPMSKVGSTDFTFPVGDVDMIEQIGISGLSGSQTFTAQYFKAAHADSDYTGPTIEAVSTVEYWDLHPASGTPTVNLVLNWNSGTFSGITDPAKLLGAHYTGTAWEEIAYISSTGDANSGSITFGPVSSYSNFTFGSTDKEVDPLPIELISFNAIANKNNTVNIEWVTATEINNAVFTVEKSVDGKAWSYVGEQKGAGNSNTTLDYAMIDAEPFSGTSYYRLKQTDFDGQFTYSEMRKVNFNGQSDINAIIVYPNPAITFIKIENCSSPTNYWLINCLGEVVDFGCINQSDAIDVSEIASGLYSLKLSNEGGTDVRIEKIIVK